jgi:dipeptidyl aminopeptidase/acylaminoacyl peptidase
LCLVLPWWALKFSAAAAALPVDTFAAGDAVTDVAISPDGHYLAEVVLIENRRAVLVVDRQANPVRVTPVLRDIDNDFDIKWCSWATNSRLLCSYHGVQYRDRLPINFTRLVAVDADGKNASVLLSSAGGGGQFEDRIIDWNPGEPDTVLVEADENLLAGKMLEPGTKVYGPTTTGAYPAVFAVNVVSGRTRVVVHSFRPILHFISDFHGTPRVGYGLSPGSKTFEYYARTGKNEAWRHLLKYEAFAQGNLLRPVAINAEDASHVYAMGDYQGLNALWSVDLTDTQPPQLVYSNIRADVAAPLLLKDGHLFGALYQTERPHVYYSDSTFAARMASVDAALPDTFNAVIDASADRTLLVVRATSDVEPGSYYLFDTRKAELVRIARANPALDPTQLGRMLPISYPARDGTSIPGYLTKPPGAAADHLPLIVMPHGGPIARDNWYYFFLQQFLVNRGYAVLQMNFRGSSGYGDQWFRSAHQDWGGLTYGDIIDGVHWAISSGVADPNRIAIVGWSFGGYAALLASVRDSDLFRCAISIAGVSDLSLLESEGQSFLNRSVQREQIGLDSAKLEAASPRRHAADVKIPLLLVHGDKDPQVNVEQSESMISALRSAGKTDEFIEIKGADHQLSRRDDRLTLLNAVDRFLSANDPVAAQ